MIRRLLVLIPFLALVACTSTQPPGGAVTSSQQNEVVATSGVAEKTKIAALTQAIRSLSPTIDPAEAALVAKIAVEYPLYTLAPAYQIVDPPLIHNMKVNMGVKPRGLCREWADDLEARLRKETLTTLSLHRAIANHNTVRIEHSTVIVSAKGAPMEQGIVLDPWRQGGGVLYWTRVLEDKKYEWWDRQRVFAYKRDLGRL